MPRVTRILIRSAALLVTVGVILAAFLYLVRPWYEQWGASSAEARQTLPGDEILRNATHQETRGITIDAGLEQVWPWLAQLGQDRGGFYSFDLLENLVGSEMPTVDLLHVDKQSWQPGGKLWMYPPEKAGGIGFATLRVYVPGRALGFATHVPGSPAAVEDGSWSFVLEPLDAYTTRLLIRGRSIDTPDVGSAVFARVIFEPMHFVMERRTMIGLKQVAEGSDRGRLKNHAQIALWTITFGLLIASTVIVFRRRDWWRPLGAFAGAAIVFQILTLVQPGVAVGAALVAWVVATLWWPTGRPHAIAHPRGRLTLQQESR
jgi:hypothetical protein